MTAHMTRWDRAQDEYARQWLASIPKHMRAPQPVERQKAMTPEQLAARIERAREMSRNGATTQQIADAIGVTKNTARVWLLPPKPKKPTAKPVIMKGYYWPTRAAFAKYLGLSDTTESERMRTAKGRAYLSGLLQ